MRSTITTFLFLSATLGARAQGPVSLSLQQAVDLAAKQGYAVQASALEAEKTLARTKEITAVGLPQISGSGTLNNYLKVPKMVVPNFFGGEGVAAIEFALPWSITGAVQLQQLLFDGSYLVGLQAAKELRTKSAMDLEQTVLNAKVQATKAYLSVLAAEEGERITAEGLPLLEKALADAQVMLEQGLLETTDADRITVQLDETRNQQRNLHQQSSVARSYLALVLGLPAGTPISLTDALQPLIDDPAWAGLADATFDANGHIDQKVAQSALRLAAMDVRNKKAAYLPSLGGFINYQQAYNYIEFDIGNGSWWFPGSMWGLQLNVPIFSSGRRKNLVKQAEFAMEQAAVNVKATEQRLLAEREQQQAVLRAAQDGYDTGKKNLALGRSIFERTSIKFNEGMASSFELTQEHGNYLTAQQNHIQRIIALLQARADMRKALGAY